MNDHLHPVMRAALAGITPQSREDYYVPERDDAWEAFSATEELWHEQETEQEQPQ